MSLKTNELILCALFSALISIGAFIKIPVPMVPFTLQFLFTNLSGLLLGKKLGSLSVGIYIVIGLLGLPIFTSGGGIGYIFEPTFGYIIGMAYYYFIANYYIHSPIGINALLWYCFVLAVPGDIIICFISAILSKRLLPVILKGGIYR
ncbi:biotin transporter BioY [Inediibacterium massiliense]|uniref:biotin transporter BioY n=1 Tax=Inediibacterium massiliense TaxID=1658111 RepID=UPI0006B69A55|nr:biotin transporter BioY [Inediibacterium massiliense]